MDTTSQHQTQMHDIISYMYCIKFKHNWLKTMRAIIKRKYVVNPEEVRSIPKKLAEYKRRHGYAELITFLDADKYPPHLRKIAYAPIVLFLKEKDEVLMYRDSMDPALKFVVSHA